MAGKWHHTNDIIFLPLKGHCHRIIDSTFTHTQNSPAKLWGRYNMKFLRESKSKSIYDDFFHDTISELENIRLMFSSFNLFIPSLPGGAGSGAWTRGSMIAREKKFGRVRLSTNALKINMEDVPSIVTFENLSWSSSVNRLLLLFVLALVNLDLLWMESQTSWMGSLTTVSTCSHLMENLPKGFYCQALVLWFLS